jgi:hypothetical protein
VSIEYSYRLVPADAFREGRPESAAAASTADTSRFTILRGADHNLHRVFVQLGGPLRFAIAGDHCPYGDYENPPGPDPVFMAYVTPDTVRTIAAALAGVPRWRVIGALRALDPWLVQHKDGRDLYSGAYDVVQAAYAAAARQGAGLRISIC